MAMDPGATRTPGMQARTYSSYDALLDMLAEAINENINRRLQRCQEPRDTIAAVQDGDGDITH